MSAPQEPTALSARPVHEPRRDDCPWCGSRDLRPRQAGPYAVDECRPCSHLFQNPRLTATGPALRLRDTGDGRGTSRRHRRTARAMLPFPEPEAWLDVGTGHAHFPQTAKEFFPYSSFDGLDPTPRVEQARAAGRVERAYVGRLTNPQLTAHLRARYDVVSMVHHLQSVPDPREELRAALTALRSGGHLLLELLDPHCAFATLLGGWWLRRTQPGRLHLMPPDNLRTELESQGCTIIPPGPADRVPPAAALLLSRARLPDTYRIIARKGEPASSA
ncbi:methyltransferase domain-containing protein [Streptomyces sp. HUCO-GS316]|uniref:class I SAM-dependent methyltransferase n=1 Tax=Streptomyces sp. HUCO-GS316 TaxID=2692198 RepID=UPI001367A5E9|nr:class I SAM-dependent methyltransferase [Streptomyces sp. HUCO-GS316]MXM69035.1 methyltransferase domain-containing protein [Streptomyces sp. HUCO-GS316]